MKPKPPANIEQYRIKRGPFASDETYGNNGIFLIPGPKGVKLKIVVSEGSGWDHVSVSRADKTPDWDEMCFVKNLFFGPDETVIQYHPCKREYVNYHAFCLHMWRPQDVELPVPPSFMVGPKKQGGNI